MLSTGGMLEYAEALERVAGGAAGRRSPGQPREAVVATEIGMLYPLRMAAPDVELHPRQPEASCRYMKMITLPKLRDALREMKYEVRVPEEIAVARVPIDRMVAIDRDGRRWAARTRVSRRRGGPTQATARLSATPAATSRTSSKVTASSAAIAASGSMSSPKTIFWLAA